VSAWTWNLLHRRPPEGAGPPGRRLGAAAAAWAVAGHAVPLLLGGGRLLGVALLQLSRERPAPGTWIGLAALALLVAYGMGYRGFQRSYGPFMVARAGWLAHAARPWQAWLAPLVAAGLLHATRRRQLRTGLVFGSMGLLALLVRQLPEPFRAGLRLGVAAGLLGGALAIRVLAARAAAGRAPAVPLELPGLAPGEPGGRRW